jgi:hypothetical protein
MARTRSTRDFCRAIAAKKRPNARIRRAVRQQFIVSNGEPILVREVLERAYIRRRPKRFAPWHYCSAYRALRQVAIVVARNRFGRGRPALWARGT